MDLYLRLHQARDFMDAHFEKELTIHQIARYCHMAPSHFLKFFHQVFKISPHQYIIRKRILSAAFLLRSTRLSLAEIMYQVGFENMSSFVRLFRKRTGLSPGKYKAQKNPGVSK